MKEYQEFLKSNLKTHSESAYLSSHEAKALLALRDYPHIEKLLSSFGGSTFDNGIFRIHTPGSSYFWTRISGVYFSDHRGNFQCFGFDWMGRHYGVDKENATIYMFDPAVGEAYELAQSIEGFLNEDLVTHREDTLVVRNFTALKKIYGDSLNLGDCIGFNTLLFLGGEDELNNYELTDMEVYWEINYQVYCKIQSLPEEKLINKISFD